jgi:hypothetical protein
MIRSHIFGARQSTRVRMTRSLPSGSDDAHQQRRFGARTFISKTQPQLQFMHMSAEMAAATFGSPSAKARKYALMADLAIRNTD